MTPMKRLCKLDKGSASISCFSNKSLKCCFVLFTFTHIHMFTYMTDSEQINT